MKAHSTRDHYYTPRQWLKLAYVECADGTSVISGRISRFGSRHCNSIFRGGGTAFYFVGGFGGGIDDISRDGQLKTYQPTGARHTNLNAASSGVTRKYVLPLAHAARLK